MNKKILLIFFSAIIINCKNNNNLYFDWGLKNNLTISDCVEVSFKKNALKFIAKEDIPKKTELLTIPNDLMFNLTKVLELISYKNLNKQSNQFSKLNLTYKPNIQDYRKEKAFLSYILYLIEHKPKKYGKTKFYEKFKYYLESLNKYSVKTPLLYYEQLQKDFLAETYFGYSLKEINKIYQDEIDILSKDTYYKREIDFEEYVNYRLAIGNKGLNISNQWTLVPFLNNFEEDYTLYNANYTIEENGDVKIRSRRKIKKGDEIVLKSIKKSNIKRLLTEGRTYEKLIDYFDEYKIPAFSKGLYYLYKIKDEQYKKYYYSLLEKNFDSNATSLYLDHVNVLNGDGTDTWAYEILSANLQYYKGLYDRMNSSQIYEYFDSIEDRTNIERIIKGEQKVIERAIKRVSKTINQFMNIQTTYMNDESKQKVIDL